MNYQRHKITCCIHVQGFTCHRCMTVVQGIPTWGTNQVIQEYEKKIEKWLKRSIIGLFVYSYNIYIWNNSIYINHKHFANVKGTIYGNRLPRGTQVKKKRLGSTDLKEIGWESVDWINLAEDRNKWRSLISMVWYQAHRFHKMWRIWQGKEV